MELSRRLQAVADAIQERGPVADIGTDHAYIPIYVILSKKADYAIAMDVRKGPLLRAKDNIASYGLEDKIETRLSDGLQQLKEEEARTIVIAGMGGELMARLLRDGSHVFASKKELILQPQSEIYKVRRQVHAMGYQIAKETMLIEEGKFYTIIRAIDGAEAYEREIDYEYGKCLLDERHPVLFQFLQKERKALQKIEQTLLMHSTAGAKKRCEQIRDEKRKIDEALSLWQ